ncbi:MAG: toll/interleukin-1 receptor domain-containing protein, partial [Micropepsaceae bacterium]
RQLDSARCVVVVWSAASIASRWVKTEANEALNRRVLIPISVDGSVPPLAFRNIQTVAFGNAPIQPDTPELDALVRALKSTIDSQPSVLLAKHDSAAVGTEPGRTASKNPSVSRRLPVAARTSMPYAVAAAVVVAATVAAYFYFSGRSSSEVADPQRENAPLFAQPLVPVDRPGGSFVPEGRGANVAIDTVAGVAGALAAGQRFAVVLDGLSVNIGTLKPRGIYDLVYETQPAAWRATGPVYPGGYTISNTDGAPDLCNPRKGALCIWGVAFRYDERGQLYFVAGGDAALQAALRDQRVGRLIHGGLKGAIIAGETFVVLLDKLADNVGTLTPGGRYEVAFLPKQRAWHATGPSYPAGTTNASTDSAHEVCAPEKDALCIWGVAFRLAGDEVRFVAGGDATRTDVLRDQAVGRILR